LAEQPFQHIEFNKIRPRIRFESIHSAKTISNIISKKLKEDNSLIQGQVLSGFATIYPNHKDQHFWSPQLTITVEDLETGSLVRGLYGPKPTVWTMFIFFYATIGFSTMIVTLIGLSFLSLGKGVAILWLVPLLMLIFASLYLTAYLGQKFGQKQMTILHHFIEECLGEKLELR